METTMESPRTSAKDFFLNLGSVAALYVSVVSLLNLLFELINRLFPDVLNQNLYNYGYYSSGIRITIACLIIFFPIYLWIVKTLARGIYTAPEKVNLPVRKWLGYLTLFLAGLTIAIDLVTLVNAFLGGDLSSQFFAKVIAVLVIASLVFSYYLGDLKQKDAGGGRAKIFASAAVIIVLASVASGFVVIGSPFTARLVKFDERRQTDLQNIQWQIITYWQKKGVLPGTLNDLRDSISGYIPPSDPESGKSYEYEANNRTSFSLCATFDIESNAGAASGQTAPIKVTDTDNNWQHGAGRTCFSRTIDPERYPVNFKIAPALPTPAN